MDVAINKNFPIVLMLGWSHGFFGVLIYNFKYLAFDSIIVWEEIYEKKIPGNWDSSLVCLCEF